MHKFRLKKDGEVVGYLQIIGRPKGILFSPSPDGVWIPYQIDHPVMIFDTADPFVCLDKNGEEVYAGSKVRDKYAGNAIVVFDELRYCLNKFVEAEKILWDLEPENIELIKD